MNRWRGWARRLRSRHGRREFARSAADMVLARMARSCTRVGGGAPPTSVSLSVRVGVALRAAAPAALRATRARALTTTSVSASGTFASSAPPPPRDTHPPASIHYSSPRFVNTSSVHVTTAAGERHVTRLHELVRTWGRPPAAAVKAAELPARLRLRSARQELPPPVPASVVSARIPNTADTVVARGAGPALMRPASLVSAASAIPAPAAPSLDVEALTGQVIQQLDRHLVAYRERMGRG